MASSAFILFFAVAAAFIVYQAYIAYRAYQRLAHFDGPRWAPFSRLWMLRAQASGSQHAVLADVCYKYGNVPKVKAIWLVSSCLGIYHSRARRTSWAKSPP
jgi:hypothetical protein